MCEKDWLDDLGSRIVDALAGTAHQAAVGRATAVAELLGELRNSTRVRTPDRFSTGHLPAVPVDQPQRIAGANPARAAIAIKNLSTSATDVVWIGNAADTVQRLGSPAFPLYGGDSITIDTTAELWVFALSGATPEIAWVSTEYEIVR